MAQSDSGGKTVLGFVIVAGLVFFGQCGGDDRSSQDTSAASKFAPMPNLVGMRAGAAEGRLDRWGYGNNRPSLYDVETADYTALDRYTDESWVVISTWPHAGRRVGENSKIRLFALHKSEIEWFKEHPRMPRIATGVATEKVMNQQGPFLGVRGLVVFRYAKGHAPTYSSRADRLVRTAEARVKDDPRVEPASERFPRDYLKEADQYSTLSVGTLPRINKRLRLGRVMTVLVKDKPPEPEPDYSEDSGGNSYYYNDDDNDFNVPGWACPTRFC